MGSNVRCNTCYFGQWEVKGEIPCNNCIGYHKWGAMTDAQKERAVAKRAKERKREEGGNA